jgi:hypothetical protein
MRAVWVLLLTVLWLLPGTAAMARPQAGSSAGPDLSRLKGRTVPGFALKKTTRTPGGVVETWVRGADGVELRIEVLTGADLAKAESRLKAVNAKIGTTGQQSEELMFRYASSGKSMAWTNYRGTHHITFKTYRYWTLRGGTLVMADVSFPRGKPDFDAARMAFVTAKKAGDGVVKALQLP